MRADEDAGAYPVLCVAQPHEGPEWDDGCKEMEEDLACETRGGFQAAAQPMVRLVLPCMVWMVGADWGGTAAEGCCVPNEQQQQPQQQQQQQVVAYPFVSLGEEDSTHLAIGGDWQGQPSEVSAWVQKRRSRWSEKEQAAAWFRTQREQRLGDESLAERLIWQLEKGGDAFAEKGAAARLEEPGTVRRLCFLPRGCRAVQLALQTLDRRAAARLARGLEGCVMRAISSPFANHVVQTMIRVFVPEEVPFVVAELSAELGSSAAELARHEYGCRVLCRLLEHHMHDPSTVSLVDAVLLRAEVLVRDKYGCHVTEYVLENGWPHQKQRVVQAVREKVLSNAQDKHAAFVFSKALTEASWEGGMALAQDLLCLSPHQLGTTFAKSAGGGMIGRALLKQQQQRRQGGEEFVQRLAEKLQAPEAQWQLGSTTKGQKFWSYLRQLLDRDAKKTKFS